MDMTLSKAPLGGNKPAPIRPIMVNRVAKQGLLTEGYGAPIELALNGANRHDMQLALSTIDHLVVARPEHANKQHQKACLDKGCEDDVRAILQVFGFTAYIRAQVEEAQPLKAETGKKTQR